MAARAEDSGAKAGGVGMAKRINRYELTYLGPDHLYVTGGQEFPLGVPVVVDRDVKERILCDNGPAQNGARWDVRTVGFEPEPLLAPEPEPNPIPGEPEPVVE